MELALQVEGVLGSRMTGGGFGGCTVTLVRRDAVRTLEAHLKKKYTAATGIECTCYEVTPSSGASVVPLGRENRKEDSKVKYVAFSSSENAWNWITIGIIVSAITAGALMALRK